jgi:hypothetical protein
VSFAGRIKQMNVKNEKNIKEEVKDEKTGAVDQIKKKYGFSLSGVSISLFMSCLMLTIIIFFMLCCFKLKECHSFVFVCRNQVLLK